MSNFAWTVLMAALAAVAGTQVPRLELTLLKSQQPPGAAPGTAFAELRLTLVNEGPKPVEARPNLGVVPKLIGSDGKPVVFNDWRNLAGYAPPALPPPPEAPVRTGERRILETYRVVRLPKGYQFIGPYGGALLPPGRYHVEVALDFSPMTRDIWVAEHAAAVFRPGARPRDPRAEATHEAERYAAHWREVPEFWRGHLDAPPLDLVLP